ncbi:hypothetical protein ACROYT_G000706 [Oculina patagonica]
MANYAFFCSLVLLVYISRSAEAVTLVEPYPNNVFAISGSAVNFTCIFVGDNGKPPLRVMFQRRKEIEFQWYDIPETERVYQTNKTEGNRTSATLHFTNITVEDDHDMGKYKCVGLSGTGGSSDSQRFTVRVTAREDLPVARVIPNVTLSWGDGVKLYCNLTHKNNEMTTPIDKVTYLRGNSPVKITNDVTQALILPSVRSRDGGNYVCRIRVLLHSRVPYEVTSSPAYLHIRVRFPIKEAKLVADIGDSVALVCSAEGYPLDVEWKKNEPGSSAIIKPDGRFILQGDCAYCDSLLMIQNVTAEDSGNYSCSARDGSGQQFFLVTVNSNSTSGTVAVTTTGPRYVTTVLPAFLWIWWPSIW